MAEKKSLISVVEKVLLEDPKTREAEYSWAYFVKVLREMGFDVFIKFDRRMPSPETLFRERRHIMNKKNLFKQDFIPEPGVTIEKPEVKE